MSENMDRHPPRPPRPRPCEACGSENLDVERKGDVIVITCKDCGHVVEKPIPPHPHHGPGKDE